MIDRDTLIATVTEALRAVPGDAAIRALEYGHRESARLAAGQLRQASEEALARTCLHEASHSVISMKLGRPVERVLVRRDGSGGTFFNPHPLSADPHVVALTCLAGVVASLIAGDERTAAEWAAAGDLLEAREAIRKARGDLNFYAGLAVDKVINSWDRIQAMASALRERCELAGMDVVYAGLGMR